MEKEFWGQAEYVTRIKLNYDKLSEKEKNISEYLINNRAECLNISVKELASKIGVGVGTIVRLCQNLGYSGFADMKFHMKQGEISLPDDVDSVEDNDDINTLKHKVINFTRESIKESIINTSNDAFERAITAIADAGKVLFCGIGSASGIAAVATSQFMTLGIPVYFVNDSLLQLRTVTFFNPEDVVIGISYDGYAKDTGDVLMMAQERGATTILITSIQNTLLTKYADIVLFTASRNTSHAITISTTALCQLATIQTLQIGVWLKIQDKPQSNVEKYLKYAELKRYDFKQKSIEIDRVKQ